MEKISTQIPELLKEAMKSKNTVMLNALRALKTALTNASIEKGSLGTELDESEEMAVLRKQIKQRDDAYEQYAKAGREDLMAVEKAELEILNRFMPAPLSDDEVQAILTQVLAETGATSKKEMGQVMKLMQERTQGRANGKVLAQLVGKALN